MGELLVLFFSFGVCVCVCVCARARDTLSGNARVVTVANGKNIYTPTQQSVWPEPFFCWPPAAIV